MKISVILYVSYDGLLEPLVQSQVLRYLEKLSSNHQIYQISFEKLDDWAQTKKPYGLTVDADKEAKRIRENAAAGNSMNTGETPVIKRRKRGWLEGIF